MFGRKSCACFLNRRALEKIVVVLTDITREMRLTHLRGRVLFFRKSARFARVAHRANPIRFAQVAMAHIKEDQIEEEVDKHEYATATPCGGYLSL